MGRNSQERRPIHHNQVVLRRKILKNLINPLSQQIGSPARRFSGRYEAQVWMILDVDQSLRQRLIGDQGVRQAERVPGIQKPVQGGASKISIDQQRPLAVRRMRQSQMESGG